MTTPAHYHTSRNRDPKCHQCSLDRKKCTLEPDAPDGSTCLRCQGQKRICTDVALCNERKKHNRELCDECRQQKQACTFPYGAWPEKKCWNCTSHNLVCSGPRRKNSRVSEFGAGSQPLEAQSVSSTKQANDTRNLPYHQSNSIPVQQIQEVNIASHVSYQPRMPSQPQGSGYQQCHEFSHNRHSTSHSSAIVLAESSAVVKPDHQSTTYPEEFYFWGLDYIDGMTLWDQEH